MRAALKISSECQRPRVEARSAGSATATAAGVRVSAELQTERSWKQEAELQPAPDWKYCVASEEREALEAHQAGLRFGKPETTNGSGI